MPDQEFLASFGVDIDEGGAHRLQSVLEENRTLAEELSTAFDRAAVSVQTFLDTLRNDLPSRPLSGDLAGVGLAGSVFSPGLDLSEADAAMAAFRSRLSEPIRLTANATGVLTAGRTAYNSLKSLFSTPLTLKAEADTGESGSSGSSAQRMSAGGRFSRPTNVEVAEDGDPEYIIPIRKEAQAVPLLRQLLGELSPAARESLTGPAASAGSVLSSGSLSALTAGSAVTTNNTVSAPVTINVRSAAGPEAVGRSVYNAAERYLLRALTDHL